MHAQEKKQNSTDESSRRGQGRGQCSRYNCTFALEQVKGHAKKKKKKKKKRDSKDEAEEGVNAEGSTYAMMALLPLKESKGMTARAYADVANGIFNKMAL